jgi:hypothetical protein
MFGPAESETLKAQQAFARPAAATWSSSAAECWIDEMHHEPQPLWLCRQGREARSKAETEQRGIRMASLLPRERRDAAPAYYLLVSSIYTQIDIGCIDQPRYPFGPTGFAIRLRLDLNVWKPIRWP